MERKKQSTPFTLPDRYTVGYELPAAALPKPMARPISTPATRGQPPQPKLESWYGTSLDSVEWMTPIEHGIFANDRINPDLQVQGFASVSERFFRFTTLSEIWDTGWTSAAEISVIPADAN